MPHTIPAHQRMLPDRVYPPDWLRRAEPDAARQTGTTLYALMQRAGEAAFQYARRCYPNARRWLVLCGHGNNGGDGYVVATLAAPQGLKPPWSRAGLHALCQRKLSVPTRHGRRRGMWH